jgi:hypothetical protein
VSRYGGNLMLSHEYNSFQYMVVYIAILQVGSLDVYFQPSSSLTCISLQGGLGAGQWLSHGPSKFLISYARHDRSLTPGDRYC